MATFVATRGAYARQAIRERRPRAVVAVACERDMVSGLHDVAGKVPVLGLTMTLPMDIRIASDSAKLGFVFARRGITASSDSASCTSGGSTVALTW